MLMEPDEYTPQERALTDKAKELIEQHELDWGNGECFIQRDAGHSELYMTLEAPNHATVTVTVPAEADEKGLRRAMADGLLDFDPDEEFDECWSREFAARNGFTPSGFLSGLQEDKAYFGLRSEALLPPRYQIHRHRVSRRQKGAGGLGSRFRPSCADHGQTRNVRREPA